MKQQQGSPALDLGDIILFRRHINFVIHHRSSVEINLPGKTFKFTGRKRAAFIKWFGDPALAGRTES